jgi:hypothetical protein
MNRLHNLMASILMLVVFITVPVAALAVTIDPDLVGLWHMDDDWKDASLLMNDLAPINSPTFSPDAKIGTNAAKFNGSNTYLCRISGNSLPLGNSPRTYMAWIKPFSYPDSTYNGILAYGPMICGKGSLLSIKNDGRLSMAFWCNDAYQTVGPQATLNAWNHIAFTYDGGTTVKFYMNGQFVQESVLSAGTPANTQDGTLRIGSTDTPGRVFNGLIDEVAIYKRALSATEIQDYYRTYVVKSPTVNPVSSPTTTPIITLSGTKPTDTAIVVNGSTLVPHDGTTTWQTTYTLSPGTNNLIVTALDSQNFNSLPVTLTVVLDATPPQVTDTTPPAVGATPAGGIYKSTQSVILVANEPAVIYYTTDGLTPTVNATTYSQPISIPVSATLKYFGRDLAGNDSEIKTENYVIDTTPPVLAISTLSDGAYTNNEILNIAGTVTDNTGVTGITVNDTAVQVKPDGSFSYALLLKNGDNVVTIAATDCAGNMAADMRTVTLDQTAPVLAVTAPADNSKTGKALLEVSGTVDKTSTVTVKIKDTVQSALMDGGAFTSTIILEPGYNTIEITATDLAGNLSSFKRTVVFDDQVPSLAVTVPNQDIRTNQSSLTIKGTVSDTLTAVGVTISKDNEIFTPPVVDGTFEQAVNFNDEKTYDLVVKATNEVGTSASVQRNVIYDITPPALSIDPVTTPTSRSSQSVSGTREPGATVTVTCTTATVGEVSYPTSTTWQADISGLREGENVIAAVSADAAGNAVTATATVVLASRPPKITIAATPEVIWSPNHTMVPVTIAGGVEANGSDIKSVLISVSDEYGMFEYNNLTFGSTVMLEAWRNGNDRDGRKYTITVVVTDRGGNATTKTATVTVPHDKSK